MEKVGGAYTSFSKWSAGKSEPLLIGDVVYFKKAENYISSSWTIGRAISLELRRDGIPKRAEDECYNSGKSFAKKQIADRAAKSLVEPPT